MTKTLLTAILLLSVAHEPARAPGACALPAGTEVSVTFKRGGSEQRTTIKLSDQI